MTVEGPGSVTNWLKPLQAGDPTAAEFVWDRYFDHVVQLARQQLQGVRDRSQDAEDVALSALYALCDSARRGQLTSMADRDDLWRLLATCTLNRCRKFRRDSQRWKRGGGGSGGTPPETPQPLPTNGRREPTPAEASQLADELRHMLALLDHEDPSQRLRQILLWKLEGYTDPEIAHLQGCARKTVAAKLSLIRSLWRQAAEP